MHIWAFNSCLARKHRWRMLSLYSVALVLTSQFALGQNPFDFKYCLDSCFTVCDSGPELLVWGCREDCGGKCERLIQSRDHNTPAPAPYGAIAFGTQGAEGISWNKGTWAAADQSAIASCSRYGSDCKVVYRYQNTCAALAVAKGAHHYETATGNTEKQAEANSTAVCKKNWGVCLSDMSACSFAKESQATGTEPAPQPHAVSWGAIAYSAPDMKAGWSSGKVDRSLAVKEAMNVCSQLGRACVLRTAFNKECGALAADGSFVGWATSTQPREAQQNAIAQCTNNGGRNCALHVFFCSN